MDDNLYQDDFEEFLQDEVRNQRMYPSDAVWRNINKELHGDNKWPALTISAFALLIATVGVCIHFAPKPNIFAIPTAYNQQPNVVSASTHQKIADLPIPAFLNRSKNVASLGNQKLNLVPVINSINSVNPREVTKVVGSTKKVGSGELAKIIPIDIISRNTSQKLASTLLPLEQTINEDIVTSISPVLEHGTSVVKNAVPAAQPIAAPNHETNVVDDFLSEHKKDVSLYTTTQIKSVKDRFSYSLYIAPSVSYRKLNEDRSGLKENPVAGGPVALNYVTDVNKVVRHKPGTGIEAGVAVMYNLTNKLRLKSGLQFNIRQYNIEAYRSSAERTSIALLPGSGIDTVNTYSVYRTNNGYISTELANRYYQIAIPLGFELEIIGTKKLQLNIAGNVQPTYLINRNAYLLSTNYKNYTESRGMINNWNLNSNIEAFISFKVGDFKWQMGPQLRYQHFSTFISAYPIKEHLMDYGFKLGVSKMIF